MNPRDDERGARAVAGGNRFAFTSAVRVRATQLVYGAAPRVFASTTNAVGLAVAEAAADEITIAQPTHMPRELGPYTTITCRDCNATVRVRRRPGVAPQGRPPTRCARHGISDNWEQIGYRDVA